MIGGKFAPLTIISNEDTDIDSVITTFNTAVTETASEILRKHRQKKTPWITAEILDLCDKRRELREKRFETEGSEKYKEVNNNICLLYTSPSPRDLIESRMPSSA